MKGLPKNIASKIEPFDEDFYELTDLEVEELEKKLNVVLPNDYKSFIRYYGGAVLDGEASVDNGKMKHELFTFFGASKDGVNLVDDRNDHEDYIKENIIPIADDSFDNRFVLDVITNKVYFIEYSDGFAKKIFISDSFAGFLRMIDVAPYN